MLLSVAGNIVLRFPVWSIEEDVILVAYGGQVFALDVPNGPEQGIGWVHLTVAVIAVAIVVSVLILLIRRRKGSGYPKYLHFHPSRAESAEFVGDHDTY